MRLRELGQDPIRLHTDEFPETNCLNIKLDSDGMSGEINLEKRTIDIKEIKSIWWRRPRPSKFKSPLTSKEKSFAHKETNHSLYGLWAALPCYWMSNPFRIAEANYKPAQLSRAAKLGFDIPRTLITNNPKDILNFHKSCSGKIIYKVMSDPSLGEDKESPVLVDPDKPAKGTYTTLLTEDMIRENLDSISLAPCQFQQYIEKRVELRVTIIGETVFCAEIDSQAQEETKYDWRHYEVPMIARPAKLPEEIKNRCIALVKGYGLNFSALDLIVTPDNRYVFLESNPNGQWVFIEKLIPEYKMINTLANHLINGL
jgi:glutathione synthase/RimK-type ligase-like ATP-grasp enzyme